MRFEPHSCAGVCQRVPIRNARLLLTNPNTAVKTVDCDCWSSANVLRQQSRE
jgi:hypothetical protein